MKKILVTIAICLVCTVNFVFVGVIVFNQFNNTTDENSNKPDIKELILLRNNYQYEYDSLENEWFLRNLKENGKYCDKRYNNLYSEFEEFQRHKTLKDSIEILNAMINNYQF